MEAYVKLPEETFDNIPLMLPELEAKVARLELVLVDLTAANITDALLTESIGLSADLRNLDVQTPPQALNSNSTRWVLTGTSLREWRLVRGTPPRNHSGVYAARYMFLPTFTPADIIAEALAKLDGRLPYLEFKGGLNGVLYGADLTDRERFGIEWTAVALLQGLLLNNL